MGKGRLSRLGTMGGRQDPMNMKRPEGGGDMKDTEITQGTLRTPGAHGGALAVWPAEQRKTLLRRLEAGELAELTFEAVVYRAGRNANYVRFRSEDMEDFAASFVGAPFLRNHDTEDIGSRDGTVIASYMQGAGEGSALRQTIKLTTPRGMRDFLTGIIDRFSIGWYWEAIECSVCGRDWPACPHEPGHIYQNGGRQEICELIFIRPRGKETSAVNTPAVPDTYVLRELARMKEARPMSSLRSEPIAEAILLPDGSARPVTRVDREGESLLEQRMQELRAAEARLDARRIEEMIETSGLSMPAQTALRLACAGKSPAEAATLVLAQRQIQAEALDRSLVQGIKPITLDGVRVTGMQTPQDRLQMAMDWLFGVQGIEPPPPSLRSIRDIYQAITGDHNWYGVFNPEWAQLASATSTTLAGMVVDALNRVTKMHYDNLATYRWYEPLVAVAPHAGTTHDVNLVMVDGVANLPVVAEGAAYTEAAVGDSKETMSFTKYGHYVGITLETIRKSDIQRIQAIPRELVKAAIRTRSAAIAGLFTANAGTGPALADDSKALFHTDHGNLTTAALDATAWAAARTKIWEQTSPGTSKPLALWPTFCLVPIELYDTALTLFGYGSGDTGKPNSAGTAQEVNPYAMSRPGDPRPIPVAVPEWTDAKDWAYLVDPRLHPVIHMAYASNPAGGSHPLPEIFEVTSESAGLMFTNDTLPVKVRDWWTYGVATYVGVGKANVT